MLDHVVFDVETQVNPEDLPNKWEDTNLMKIGCACLWEYRTQRMRVYGQDDIQALRDRLEKADKISGFNINSFDLNVVYEFPRSKPVDWLLPKCNDVLDRIWKALGTRQKGFGLGFVGMATLGVGKVDSGENAPQMYKDGKFHQLISYCCDDVCLERDLADFVDRFGFIVNPNTKMKLPIPPWSPGSNGPAKLF